VQKWLATRLNESEVLVISSTRTAADEFARQMSGPGSLGLQCLSLAQVMSELALLKSAELGLASLSRLGEEAVAARITHRLNTAGDLDYFRPVAQFSGFASLAIVLDEAHRLSRDITLPKLMKEGRKFGVVVISASQGVTDFHPDVLALFSNVRLERDAN